MTFQAGYEWLLKEPGPNMLKAMISMYGTHEAPGASDNAEILVWGREVGHPEYVHDSIPWCGLAVAKAAKDAGWPYNPKGNSLWAENWLSWEDESPGNIPMLGDVVVFGRTGGGHVSIYVGEDPVYYHILGGNQSDQVNIIRKSKAGFLGARRPHWKIAQPTNVRRIHLSSGGAPTNASVA